MCLKLKGLMKNKRLRRAAFHFLDGRRNDLHLPLQFHLTISIGQNQMVSLFQSGAVQGTFSLCHTHQHKGLILPGLHAMLHINTVYGVVRAPDQLLNGIFLFFRVYHAVSACITAVRPAEICIYPQSITLAEKTPF